MATETRKDHHPAPTPRVRMVEVAHQAGQRLDNFLLAELKGVPRSRVYRMIRKGEVRVNGGRVRATYRLSTGDRVRIPPVRQAVAPGPAFIGERNLHTLEAAILHEDGGLLVLNKPAGLAVHGGSGVAYGVIEALRRLRPTADLELVHRLDRDTSGCLLVAKRRSVLRELHQRLRDGDLEKTYALIVRGRWPRELTRVDVPLTRFVTPSGERRVRADREAGKASLTTFQVQARASGATLLQAVLHTGRTHQIRVHCQLSGHGILGDEKYGGEAELAADRALGVRRLCLHARRIVIPGGRVFQAPLPEEIVSAWRLQERLPAQDG